MKILDLNIKGYRSLKEVTWQPGALNVIIGPNGSGKSNLLRFLELISVSAQGRLGKHIQALGGMEAILWDGRASAISFGCTYKFLEEESSIYELQLARIGLTSSYIIQEEALSTITPRQEHALVQIARAGLKGRVLSEAGQLMPVQVVFLNEEESLLSTRALGMDLDIQTLQTFLLNWRIYHDIDVSQSAPLRQSALARTERWVDSDGQNLIQVLHTLYNENRDFKNAINAAMRAAFGDDFEELLFPPAADNRIQMRVRWKSLKREQSAADLSDGTLRFLLLLTILANPFAEELIAIDEPEAGLHPAMLPIIAEYAVDASARSQIIFTTHSPQFLDAFTDTKPTTTVARWQDGETKLNILQGDQLASWLQEYSLGALFTSGELEEMG